MLTTPDTTERNDAVAQLKGFIAEGAYRPGDRLPPEREMLQHFGVTRTTLRKALDRLEREGVIWRHVGKGTFIADPMEFSTNGGVNGSILAIGEQVTPVKMMRARLCIEPAIAREAAINASRGAIARIHEAREAAQAALTWEEYEAQDDRFHRALAEAADNILLTAIFDHLNHVRRAVALSRVIRETAGPPEGHRSFNEHDRIAAAIEAHDPAAAHELMRIHLGSVSARLFGET